MSDIFVREHFEKDLPPPASRSGAAGWIRQNLFPNWWNTLLTVFCVYLISITLIPAIKFLTIDAVWNGNDRSACLGPDIGACWPFIKAKYSQFVYGRYPLDERWRVDIVFYSGLAGLIAVLIPSLPGKLINIVFLLGIYPVVSFILLSGGFFGLQTVETSLWGGLLVTLVVAVTGIVASFPFGVLLALGRRSRMDIVRYLSITFIEFWRGVPLITVLFMSSVLLPLFLPEGVNFDKLLRALIGVALFSSAYMAEVVRGGLQAIPQGQFEGAKALGLGYWRMMYLIILPQALKHVIPGIVNSFIALFKDTTLVLTIGIFDLLGIIQLSYTDTEWATPVTSHTGYAFAAIIFWIFCFCMSRYSLFMEKRLNTGHHS